MSFHPFQPILAVGSKDCTIRIYDVSKHGGKGVHKQIMVSFLFSFFFRVLSLTRVTRRTPRSPFSAVSSRRRLPAGRHRPSDGFLSFFFVVVVVLTLSLFFFTCRSASTIWPR